MSLLSSLGRALRDLVPKLPEPTMQTPRSTEASFFACPLQRSWLETADNGDLIRVEVRRDPVTKITLMGRFPAPRPRTGYPADLKLRRIR